ncbi:MAG TPA: DUF4388 domain-containing protein [Planctomycetota bacterium]|nr:DUF4388 domain-containing protein [Planctomycetota bacterium]
MTQLSGRIEHGELLTALRLVSRGRGTGAVVVFTAYATATVAFEEGGVLWANATTTPKFGDLLVEKGLVKRDKLDAALWVQRQDREWRPIGRVLVDVKVLSEEVVALAVEAQVVRVLSEILGWERGSFRFEDRPPAGDGPVRPASQDLDRLEIKVAMLRAKDPGVPANGSAESPAVSKRDA